MRSFKYDGQTFKHGDRVTCSIEGVKIDDAKISEDDRGNFYICQNKKRGDSANDLLGYDYSWTISISGAVNLKHTSIQVENLRLVTDDYEIF